MMSACLPAGMLRLFEAACVLNLGSFDSHALPFHKAIAASILKCERGLIFA
jgi:hypothetical protein